MINFILVSVLLPRVQGDGMLRVVHSCQFWQFEHVWVWVAGVHGGAIGVVFVVGSIQVCVQVLSDVV